MKNGHRPARTSVRADHDRKIRFALVGLTGAALDRVLPAFDHTSATCELVALVSGDRRKLRSVGRKHHVSRLCAMDDYQQLLDSGEIDAVYLALPDPLHVDYTLRAARSGIHVLCEKPMEVGEARKLDTIKSSRQNDVTLMFAYRMQFTATYLQQATPFPAAHKDIFDAIYTLQGADQEGVRLQACADSRMLNHLGGYCINAARYLFQNEPKEVIAFTSSAHEDSRLPHDAGTTRVIMRFPDNRLTSFICDVTPDAAEGSPIGQRDDLRPSLSSSLVHQPCAAELLYFSGCILQGTRAQPALHAMAGTRLSPAWNLRRPAATHLMRRKTSSPTRPMSAAVSDVI